MVSEVIVVDSDMDPFNMSLVTRARGKPSCLSEILHQPRGSTVRDRCGPCLCCCPGEGGGNDLLRAGPKPA